MKVDKDRLQEVLDLVEEAYQALDDITTHIDEAKNGVKKVLSKLEDIPQKAEEMEEDEE